MIITDIKDMLGQEQEPIIHIPYSPPRESLFRKSLTFTHVCRLLRREFRPIYLERVPIHIITRYSMAFLETFIAQGNARSLTASDQTTRATLVLRRGHYDFVDIKSLVLLARRFPNIACTSWKDKYHSLREQQLADWFLEKFTQIEEFRPEFLSALEHDIASIYVGYVHSIDFHIVFKSTCTRPWMNMVPTLGLNLPTNAQGGLQEYIQELGLADFGLEELGFEKFSMWELAVEVS
jgi:hypothetical protein